MLEKCEKVDLLEDVVDKARMEAVKCRTGTPRMDSSTSTAPRALKKRRFLNEKVRKKDEKSERDDGEAARDARDYEK